MATEFALGNSGYANDFLLGPTGDFIVLQDTPGNPAASQQRLARIVLTNPLTRDAYGNPVGKPDDIFNPGFGSGAPALIGEPLTPALTARLQNRILAGIAADPNFATTPTPTVTPYVDGTGDGQIYLAIVCYTVTGQIVTIPSLPLQNF